MSRVTLYARYSSDNQSESSIEDQFRLCREHARREQWKITGTYHDAAISGASMILRPGIQALLQDAQRGVFDVVLAEALDRISRDQADVATLFKHLRFAGVSIITLAEGEISELHVGLKGTMNALLLKDLALKTHRGLRGRVEKGKAGGGLCYGYRVVRKPDADGEPIRGDREIGSAGLEQRHLRGEMIHQDAEHIGLEVAPFDARRRGHRHEVRSEEHAGHIAEPEQSGGERRGLGFLGRGEVARALFHHGAAGQELQRGRIGGGFGFDQHGAHVASVSVGIKR